MISKNCKFTINCGSKSTNFKVTGQQVTKQNFVLQYSARYYS